MFPKKEQWKKWPLANKLNAIGTYATIIALFLSIAFYFAPPFADIRYRVIQVPKIPGDTGWLLLGELDHENTMFTRGPFFEIVKSNYYQKDILPRKGEHIRINVDRNVIIADFKTAGLKNVLIPPWKKDILEETDYTGIKVSKGSIVEVRDVSLAHFPKMPYVVWVRIGYVP